MGKKESPSFKFTRFVQLYPSSGFQSPSASRPPHGSHGQGTSPGYFLNFKCKQLNIPILHIKTTKALTNLSFSQTESVTGPNPKCCQNHWPIPKASGQLLGSSLVQTQMTKLHMGVSENNGTPKWMVYNGKPY